MLTIQKNIIDELNAEWNDSEIHIIYGKSGCGKSYLAQEIIAQFQAEQSKNILSLVLTKTLNQMDRIKALEILKPYRLISSVNNEFDLWLRIMMTYMTSSIHLGQRNEALHIEKELYIQLSSKLGYDDNAIKYINILRRRSNAIHDCNISKEYIIWYSMHAHNSNFHSLLLHIIQLVPNDSALFSFVLICQSKNFSIVD